jgi:hypothetical protein
MEGSLVIFIRIRNSWGSSTPAVDASEVKQARASAARADR